MIYGMTMMQLWSVNNWVIVEDLQEYLLILVKEVD